MFQELVAKRQNTFFRKKKKGLKGLNDFVFIVILAQLWAKSDRLLITESPI